MSKKDLTVMPAEYSVTPDLDCVLLNDYRSYCSLLTNLAAEEKGLRWKRFNVDIARHMENLQPWYLKVNHQGYVPTMLVEGNKSVIESADIIRYMDDHFEGTTKLLQRDDEQLMAKFKEFHDCHENFNPLMFTYGHHFKNNFLIKAGLPLRIGGVLEKIMKYKEDYPEYSDLYEHKLIVNYKRYAHINEEGFAKSQDQARDLLDLCEKNLSEPQAEFALGSGAQYSLADVFMTGFLTRLQTDHDLFKTELKKRPLIA